MLDQLVARTFVSALFTATLAPSSETLEALLTPDWPYSEVFAALAKQTESGDLTEDALKAAYLAFTQQLATSDLQSELTRESSAEPGDDIGDEDDETDAVSALTSPQARSAPVTATARLDEALTASIKREPFDPIAALHPSQQRGFRALAIIIRDSFTYLPYSVPPPVAAVTQSDVSASEIAQAAATVARPVSKSIAMPRDGDVFGLLLIALLQSSSCKAFAHSTVMLIEQLGSLAHLKLTMKKLLDLVQKGREIQMPPNVANLPFESIDTSEKSTEAFVTNHLTPSSFMSVSLHSLVTSIDVVARYNLRSLIYRCLDCIATDSVASTSTLTALSSTPPVWFHFTETPMLTRFPPFALKHSERMLDKGYTWHMFVSVTGFRDSASSTVMPNIVRFFNDGGAGTQFCLKDRTIIAKVLPGATEHYQLKGHEFRENQWIHLAVTHSINEKRVLQPTAMAVAKRSTVAHSQYPHSQQMRAAMTLTQAQAMAAQQQQHGHAHHLQPMHSRSMSNALSSPLANSRPGRLSMFINGEIASITDLPYPNLDSTEILQLVLGGFYGRIGGFALFDTALEPSKIATLYAAGAGQWAMPGVHAVQNKMVAVVPPPPCATSSIIPASSLSAPSTRALPDLERLVARAIYLHSPCQATHGVCLPFAWPEGSEMTPRPSMPPVTGQSSTMGESQCQNHMFRLDGVSVVQNVDNAANLASMGGLRYLLLAASPSYQSPSYHSDADVADLLVLIASLTMTNESLAHELLEYGASPIKQLLLDHCKRRHKTLRLVSAIRKLILAVKLRDLTPERSHFASFVSTLVMDFAFWRTSSGTVQSAVVRLLAMLVALLPQPFCAFDIIGVARIVDTIRAVYLPHIAPRQTYFLPPKVLSPSTEVVARPVNLVVGSNAETLTTTPTQSQRAMSVSERESPTTSVSALAPLSTDSQPPPSASNSDDLTLAVSLLDIALVIAKESVQSKTFERDCLTPILHAIYACQASLAPLSASLLSLYLNTMLLLLSISHQRVLTFLHQQQFYILALKMLVDQPPVIRVLALKVLGHLTLHYSRQERVERDKKAQLDYNSLKEHIAAMIVSHLRQVSEITCEEFECLFQLLIGQAPGFSVDGFPLSLSAMLNASITTTKPFIVEPGLSFSHPAFLSMVLELAILAPLTIQSKILVDVLSLLRTNAENFVTLNQLFWARLLLPFVSRLHFNPATNIVPPAMTPHSLPVSPMGVNGSFDLSLDDAAAAVTPHAIDQLVYQILQTMTVDAIANESKGYQRVDQAIWCLNAKQNLLANLPQSVKDSVPIITITRAVHDTWTLEMSLFYRVISKLQKHVRLLSPRRDQFASAELSESQLGNVRRNLMETLEMTEWLLFHSPCSFLTKVTNEALGIRDVDKLPIAVRVDPNIDDVEREQALREMLAANEENPNEAQVSVSDDNAATANGDSVSAGDLNEMNSDDAPQSPTTGTNTGTSTEDDEVVQGDELSSVATVQKAAQRSPDNQLTPEELEVFSFLLTSVVEYCSIVEKRQDILRLIFRFLLIVLPSPVCAPLTETICSATRLLFVDRITERVDKNFRLVALSLSLLKTGMDAAIRRQDLPRVESIKRTMGQIFAQWGEIVFIEGPVQRKSSLTAPVAPPVLSPSNSNAFSSDLLDMSLVSPKSASEIDESEPTDTNIDANSLSSPPASGDPIDEATEACLFHLYAGDGAAVISETQKLFLKHQMHFNYEYERRAAKIQQSIYEWNSRQNKTTRLRELKFSELESHVMTLTVSKAIRPFLTQCYAVKRNRAVARLNDREERLVVRTNKLLKQSRRENSNSRPLPLPLPPPHPSLLQSHLQVIRDELNCHSSPAPYQYATMQSLRNAYSHSRLVEYWKLDSSEGAGASRMRRLLKKNFTNGDPHTFASAASHTGKVNHAKSEQIDLMKVNLVLVASHSAEQSECSADDKESTAPSVSVRPAAEPVTPTKVATDSLDDDGDADNDNDADDDNVEDDNTIGDDGLPRDRIHSHVVRGVFATMITPTHKFIGILEITPRAIIFNGVEHIAVTPAETAQSKSPTDEDKKKQRKLKEKHVRWPWKTLRQVWARYFLLRESALELFFANGKNYFFHFTPMADDAMQQIRDSAHGTHILMLDALVASDKSLGRPGDRNYRWRRSGRQQRNDIYGEIQKQVTATDLADKIVIQPIEPSRAFERYSELTKCWQRGQISNFTYLMHLNTLAGRSFNDMNQYPVFPWIITDYKSTMLDLSDPAIYRDLSRPIGALNEDRYEIFRERYETFEDDSGGMQPFLYGSHYSSAGIALHYLIRMEPFTSLAIQLQGGHFDLPDRLFDSIAGSWDLSLNNMADVKELIPEFFYHPDFLRNTNGLDLGKKQGGIQLGDVQLPPWATTPEEFIRLNREALESDYVSAHLHEWIDLIFGFKQKGEQAKQAKNVFFYLTYHGAVDIDAIDNAALRKATEDQVANFGQTPMQLLTQAHPRRLTSQERARYELSRILLPLKLTKSYTSQIIYNYQQQNRRKRSDANVIAAGTTADDRNSIVSQLPKLVWFTNNHQIVTVASNFSLQSHSVAAFTKSSPTLLFPANDPMQAFNDPHGLSVASRTSGGSASDRDSESRTSSALSADSTDSSDTDIELRAKLHRRGPSSFIDSRTSAKPTAADFVPASIVSSHVISPLCPHWFLPPSTMSTLSTPSTQSGSSSAAAHSRALAPNTGHYRSIVGVLSRNGRFLFTGGYFDGAVKVHELVHHEAHLEGLGGLDGGTQSHHVLASLAAQSGSGHAFERPSVQTQSTLETKPSASIIAHQRPVTAVALSTSQATLVTGDAGGSVAFWRVVTDIHPRQQRTALPSNPPVLLAVHEGPVLAIAICQTWSSFVTLAQDKQGERGCEVSLIHVRATMPVLMHTIVFHDPTINLRLCAMTASGNIVLYGTHANVPKLWLYSINGALLTVIDTNDVLSVLTVTPEMDKDGSPDRGFVVTGGRRGQVVFRSPNDLSLVQTFHTDGKFPHTVPHGINPPQPMPIIRMGSSGSESAETDSVDTQPSLQPQLSDEWTVVDQGQPLQQSDSDSDASLAQPTDPELERVYTDPTLSLAMGVTSLDIATSRKYFVVSLYPDPDLVAAGLLSDSNPLATEFSASNRGLSVSEGRLLLFALPLSNDPESLLGFYIDASHSSFDPLRDSDLVSSALFGRVTVARDAALEAVFRSRDRTGMSSAPQNSANKAVAQVKTKVVGALSAFFGGKK